MKKLFKIFSLLAVIIGLLLIAGGVWGTYFTYTSIAKEKIITPQDASIPNKAVLGPLTLKAQSEIIRDHTLKATGGKTFAEMPREIPQTDENGQPILDQNDQPLMKENSSRDIWITATTLTTALHLAILTYAFSSLTILLGCIFTTTGVLFYVLQKRFDF